MPAGIVQAELPVQQHIGKCIGLEERHAPIHNNAEGDADADVGQQCEPAAVLLAEMTDRDGGVNLQDRNRRRDERVHDELRDDPARSGRQRVYAQIAARFLERLRNVAEVERREHSHQKHPAQQRDNGARHGEDHARERFGGDVRRARHGQREHEIPLVSEKALIKAVDNKNEHKNTHRNIERHKQDHRQDTENEAHEPTLSITREHEADRKAVDRAEQRQADPDQRKRADAGAQIVFHQFTEHCIPLHSP